MATKQKEVIKIFSAHLNTIRNSSLFKNIETASLIKTIKCMNPRIVSYKEKEEIVSSDTKITEIGVILKGSVEISKYKKNGNKIIMNKFYKKDIFGELITFSNIEYPYITVTADSDTTILFLKAERLKKTCSNSCAAHNTLISNIMEELANKAVMLNLKVEYLSIKSMRSKICTFLYNQYIKSKSKKFNIYLNRNELANFLNVSRPSMSRELGKLKNENIINFKKNQFEILNIKKLSKYLE